MKVENRQKFLIVLTAVAAVLLIGNSVIYNPLANLWSSRSDQIKAYNTKVHDGKLLVQREATLRSRWGYMNTNALPANTSLAENQVLTALTTWSRGSGTDVTSVMPQWKNDSTNYMTLNCHVQASGTLLNLSQFIYRIEQGPMALKLDSMELSAHDTTGEQITLDLQISGLALLQPTTPMKR
jgi:Tfp pilus assembly protein PilO